jgi:hypothetical protein
VLLKAGMAVRYTGIHRESHAPESSLSLPRRAHQGCGRVLAASIPRSVMEGKPMPQILGYISIQQMVLPEGWIEEPAGPEPPQGAFTPLYALRVFHPPPPCSWDALLV